MKQYRGYYIDGVTFATEAQRLMSEGKLQPTGRILTFETRDGEIIKLPEAEPLHTFAMWKSLDYRVKKGEHAITKLTIWKYANRRTDNDEEDTADENGGHCFRKLAYFFSASQVEPMEATA